MLYLQACVTPLSVSARACHSAIAVRGEAGEGDAGRDRGWDAELCPILQTCHAEYLSRKVVAAKDHWMPPAYRAIRMETSCRHVLLNSPGGPKHAPISFKRPTSSFSGVAWLLLQSSRTHASTSHVSRPPAGFACMTINSSHACLTPSDKSRPLAC